MTAPTDDIAALAEPLYPTLGRRYFAALIDGLVVVGGMLLVGTLLGDVAPAFEPVRAALFVGLFLGYEPVCTAFAATVGQRLMGFRVRRAATPTQRISLPAALLRYVVKVVLGLVSFVTMGFSRQRRAIHDLVSGSVALEVSSLPDVLATSPERAA